METVSKYHLLGQAHALQRMGFPEDRVKVAFETRYGLSPEVAEELVKEAIWRSIGKGMATGGKWLAGKASKLMPLSATRGARAASKTPLVDATKGGISSAGTRVGDAVEAAGTAFAANPLQTLKGGLWQAGKGMTLQSGAAGIGGALGRGATGAAALHGIFGGGGKPQQQRY